MNSSEECLELLKKRKVKITPKRKAIIDFFKEKDCCLTPETVWGQLKKKFKHFGLPSVYRNLELFVKCGILTPIQKKDRRLYYALCQSCPHDHHHHIVCIECGCVKGVDVCSSFKKEKIKGFKIINHTIQLEGVCPKCQ